MLDLIFYSKGTKPFGKKITWEGARICCKEEDYENEFEEGTLKNLFFKTEDLCFGEVPVFEIDHILPFNISDMIFKNIENIVKKNKPEVVLISPMDFFKRAVHFSKGSEMEPQMIITENRNMLYYSMIGEDRCALLVAWDDNEDFEEDEES